MRDVTVVTSAWNALHALELMRESFLRHHPEPVLWYVADDGSKDGALEYLREHADLLFENDHRIGMGANLDRLCLQVGTPYTLVLDSDLEFLGPVLPRLISEIEDAFCIAPSFVPGGKWDSPLGLLDNQPKIDHSTALFRTDQLQRILGYVSFSQYVCTCLKKNYDGGGMLLTAARCIGLQVKDASWVRNLVVHYGGLSSSYLEPEECQWHRRIRHECCKARLERFRAGVPGLDGLMWRTNGQGWQPEGIYANASD